MSIEALWIIFQEKTTVENEVTERNSKLEEAKTAQDEIIKQNVSFAGHPSKKVLPISLRIVL